MLVHSAFIGSVLYLLGSDVLGGGLCMKAAIRSLRQQYSHLGKGLLCL